jgi:hypothetical protein
VFKRLQQARPIKQDGENKYVYALNYYDFIYDERFAVNLESFIPEVSARRNPFEPTYSLSFTSTGPIQTVQTKDGLLATLLTFSDFLTMAQDGLTGAMDALQAIPIVSAVMFGANAALTGLYTLSNLAANLSSLSSKFTNAIAGQTSRTGGISGKVNSFIGDLKG